MKDFGGLRKILKPEPKRVRIENPTTIEAQLYQRAEVNGEIVRTPYTCQIAGIDGVPYKVVGWDQNIATCQECTAQEVADLAEQWASSSLRQSGEA